MVAALLPYLGQQYRDSVFKFFTPVACDRVMTCQWDKETNQVISAHDQAVDEATIMDEDFHFEDQIEVVLPPSEPTPTGETAAYAKDTDTISPFRNTSHRQRLPPEQQTTNTRIPQRVLPQAGQVKLSGLSNPALRILVL